MSDLQQRHPLDPPRSPPGQYEEPDLQPVTDDPEQDMGTPPTPRASGWPWIALLLVVLVFSVFLFRDVFLIIRNVQVQGVRQRPWQEVAIAAGFAETVNYFGINEARVREGINEHRYFTYLGMDKRFPNTIILRVRERIPAAIVQYIGVGYLLADDGVVLEQTKELAQTQGYASISGLQLRDIRVGAVPTGLRPQQITSALIVLRELAMQGYLQSVLDINVAEPSSIYLTTRDGFTIHLGDDKELRAKIGTVRAVVEDLKSRALTGGVIEATLPGEATYRPETQ